MTDRHVIDVAGGEAIVAVHHRADSDDWLVFCHGLISDKSGSYEDRCIRAVAEGFNAVRFDFRGCGESDGAFVDQTLRSKLNDLGAVAEYFDLSSYAVFGSSFGAKVALHRAVADDRISAVVGRAPVTYNDTFSAAREVVDSDTEYRYSEEYRLDRRFFEVLDDHPFGAVEARLRVPVAFVHGREDESVPAKHSVDAAASLDGDVLLQLYADEGHRFSREAEERMQEIVFGWLRHLT